MFYEENQISKNLNCPICKNRYDKPKILPCANVICNNCIVANVDKNSSEFKCLLCPDMHKIPQAGFPICKPLFNILLEESNDVYRGESIEKLKTNLKDIQSQINNLTFDMNHGIDKIKEHCSNLRIDIQLASEATIQQLNEITETMLNKINSYERDCIDKFQKDKIYKEKFCKTINRMFKFHKEWDDNLRNFRINENEILKANEFAESFKIESEILKKKLNEEHFFNGRPLIYEKNATKVSETILGSFKLQGFQVVEPNLQKIDLSSLLSDLNKKSHDQIEIECLENGNIFIVYRTVQKYLKYLIFNKDKTIEKSLIDSEKLLSILKVKKHNNLLCLNYHRNDNAFNKLRILDENLNNVREIDYSENFLLKGVNESFIYCLSRKPTSQPLFIYNWELQFVKCIGQRTKPSEPFYFPSNIKQIENKNGKYFWLNDDFLNIVEETTGNIIKTIKISSNKFVFDSKNNLVVMSKLTQKLSYFNMDGQLLSESEIEFLPPFDFRFFIDNYDKPSFFDTSELSIAI